jgi:cellulose synthase/poly-beta-1,6-N-acetylglucosamine synthase-like glycosyltransferase
LDTALLTAAAYAATLGLIGFYGFHRVSMLARFRWRRGLSPAVASEPLPPLTVQLPVYNERTVAARLIRSVGRLEYPRDRFEIQVLDDSTDETRAIVDAEVLALRARGIEANVVRRADRVGFKAGALAHGLLSARGSLVAIFDADFEPDPDFLLRLVPRFEDRGVGMVQARWGHSNRDDCMLTRAESALLDGHFVIEHKVRSDSRVFFNFNGTAGIWRREAIVSAGGWQHDTLTEDLDLSYRAQLAGWRFVYEPTVVAPAEVPPDIAAFKSQQHRWTKGSVQVFRKLGWRILTARQPLRVKLEAFTHLTGNVGYPAVLLLALLLPLAAAVDPLLPPWIHMALFVSCTLSVLAFYDRSQRVVGRPFAARVVDTFAALALGIGMCVSLTRSVVEGLLPGTGVFVRTPKRGEGQRRYRVSLRGLPGVELVFAAWFGWGIATAAERGDYASLPFMLLFFSGFAWVGGMSVAELLRGMFSATAPELEQPASSPSP